VVLDAALGYNLEVEKIKREIEEALGAVVGTSVELAVPEKLAHGDYTTNVALQMFSQMHSADGGPSHPRDFVARRSAAADQHNAEDGSVSAVRARGKPSASSASDTSIFAGITSPRGLAEKIVEEVSRGGKVKHYIKDIQIAGPGFINFYLSDEALQEGLGRMGESFGRSDLGKGKTVLVEYSSPNIAKRFGIGHLRSTVIGQALRNLLEDTGHTTIGENHLGDWGTQFGMILAQIDRKALNEEVETLSVEDLETLYVEFNDCADKDEELRELAKEWFKKLEAGDSEARRMFEAVHKTSMSEFDTLYDLLDIHIENSHGESFYEDKMDVVIAEARKKGISKRSQGAEIVEFDDMPPAMLLKSDGTTTYFTRDLAAIKYRLKTYKPNLIIYEVGSDQILHFKQVFAAAKMLGWGRMTDFVHMAHGLIRFPEGKMSTRLGRTVNLQDVLDKAIKKARELGSENEEVAKMVGIGALKYFDLKHKPTSEIVFSWDEILALDGNSGPYLQYTYARTQSVLHKSGVAQADLASFKVPEDSTNERDLIRYLYRYPGAIMAAQQNYSPNLLCNYLFELAQLFNSFYNAEKIIGSGEEKLRLSVTAAVGQTLKNGLSLLGISTPEKM